LLLQLRLQNLATIKELEAEFDSGFSILTGETGAGKSIMIDALLLVLGGRGDVGLIRTGEEQTVVEAVFDLSQVAGVRTLLEEAGIPAENELILRCVIPRKGRQRRSINGAAVTMEFLKTLGQQLVNIHGQHENQALLQVGTHLEFLDQHGKLVSLRNTVREAHSAHQQALAEQRDLAQRLSARQARIEELTIIREELEELNLQEGEDEALQQEVARLSNTERLSLLVGQVPALLHDDEGAVLTQLESARRTLSEAERVDPTCTTMREALESALFQLEDVHQEVARYTAGIEENPERLAWINERLNRIQRLQRKHKLDSGEALRGLLDSVIAELETLEHLEEDGQALAERIAACEAKLKKDSETLSERRQKAARKLDSVVVRELRQLGMEKARFETQLTLRETDGQPQWTPSGMDRVEFLLSVNPGQALRNLAKVASGGELSRIMLALKTVLTSPDTVEILIFDEVDSGISGRVAEIVGQKLRSLGTRHQTLCITHLPQIAAFSEHHYVVSKELRQNATFTSIARLESPDEKTAELAKLLGSSEVASKAEQLARDMLARAQSLST